MATIAGVKGNQFVRGTQAYVNNSYQYASSTYSVEHDMNPGLIVQPRNKEDISLTIKYCKANKLAMAIRTGGHQYSGASSTSVKNVLLDLKDTFQGPDDRAVFRKGDKVFVRSSVSWGLGDFNAYLAKNNVFIPHGQCTAVHVGGHVQTGGYGQLGRSFGLFGDHVISLEIVNYAGEFKEITKATDADLFWAILGGSPGNFGVITHFTVEVHRDQDHQGSRGLRALFFYDTAVLKRLLDIMVKMSDDGNWPRNYDYCVSVLSSSFPLLDLWPEIDTKMREEHPEIYGENGIPFWPRMIIVYAQWVPFTKDDKCDMSWFEQIDRGSLSFGVQEKPMSQLTSDWIFRNTREFEHPYVKRTYATKSNTLGKDGWTSWITKRIDAIVKPEANRCWISAQLQYFGGKYSKFTTNAGNGTSFSWRDSTMVATVDCFHSSSRKERAEDWAKVNDDEGLGPNGIFSKQDRRLLWGSWGDFNMDNVWNCYHEDRAKYEKLQKIRKRADPDGVFTPNTFCVKRAT